MAGTTTYYPPWGFYYKVEFGISSDNNDVRFQSVSGLSVEYDYENFNKAFRDREFEPTDINVILMNEKGEPLRTWKVAHAIPKKWLVSDLVSTENAIVIETMEITYRYFTVQ